MPLSKSSRSSKSASRPSLFSSLSSRSSHSIPQTASHDRQHLESLGQPEKVLDSREPAKQDDDESAADLPRRRKSRLNVLTSFFSPSSTGSVIKKTSLPANDSRRPKTATGEYHSHKRENPVLRDPVASAFELTNNSSSFDDSPNTVSNTNGSISTVDHLSEALERGTNTPASQHSTPDFGLLRTESPESSEPPTESQNSAKMATLQKHQKGTPSVDKALPRAPVARRSLDGGEQPRSTRGSGEETPSSGQLSSPLHATKIPARGANKLQPQKLRRPESPIKASKARSSSAQPISRTTTFDHARTASTPLDSSPISRQSNDGEARGRVRRSWLPGSGARSSSTSKASKDLKKWAKHHNAWIISPDSTAEYNTAFLENGDKVMITVHSEMVILKFKC